jgi:hypothetical protein
MSKPVPGGDLEQAGAKVPAALFAPLMERRLCLPATGPISVGGIIAVLEQAGIETLLSGGSVRDCLNGGTPVDADLTSLAPAETVKDALVRRFGPGAVAAFWPNVGTVIVGDPAGACVDIGMSLDWRSVEGAASICAVEFAYSPSLESDVRTRDFCCNALYWSPARGLIDPTGRGRRDAQQRRLSICMAPQKIAIDPRLCLRIALFCARGYRPDRAALAHFLASVDCDVDSIGAALGRCLDEMTRADPATKRSLPGTLRALGAAPATIAKVEEAIASPVDEQASYLLARK